MIDEEDLRSRNVKAVGCWKQSRLQFNLGAGLESLDVQSAWIAISSWPPFAFGYESRL